MRRNVGTQLELFAIAEPGARSPEVKYVDLHYVSTEMNPMFKCGTVPYAWTNGVDAKDAERLKREAEARWPNVTVTIKERAGDNDAER